MAMMCIKKLIPVLISALQWLDAHVKHWEKGCMIPDSHPDVHRIKLTQTRGLLHSATLILYLLSVKERQRFESVHVAVHVRIEQRSLRVKGLTPAIMQSNYRTWLFKHLCLKTYQDLDTMALPSLQHQAIKEYKLSLSHKVFLLFLLHWFSLLLFCIVSKINGASRFKRGNINW